jgi:hypothetical protein
MNDLIGSSDMIQGNLTSFRPDRFGCLNSAMTLRGGWTQVPSGIYFNSPEFTISVWVYPKSLSKNARLIDFGNGLSNDNIILDLSVGRIPTPKFGIDSIINAVSSQNLTFDEWQFLTVTFNGTTSSIYQNGTLTVQVNGSYLFPTLNRTNCYIGKSHLASSNGDSFSYLDDLRFYNKSLTQTEIRTLMNQNQTSEKFKKKV